MWFNLLYVLFVFAVSFGGSIRFAGVTPRQVAAVMMFCICISNYKIIRPYFKYFLSLYLSYLLIAFISAIFDGFASSFFRSLISQHLVAMVCLGAIVVYYHRRGNFDVIIKAFIVCGLINAAVCLLQYVGHPVGIGIGYLFIGENDLQANRHMEQLVDGTGSGYLLGMRSDAVHNGYFMMIMPFLLLHLYKNSQSKLLRPIETLLFITLLILFCVVILLIQERSCILIVACVFLLYLRDIFKRANTSRKVKFIFTALIGFSVLLYVALPYFIDYLSESRFSGESSGIRTMLFKGCLEFIPSHPLLGGWNSFLLKYDFPPHNIFLNACVEAGLIGFIIAFRLYVKQIKIAYSIPKNSRNVLIYYTFLAYTLNSQLHNDSILTGDVIVWMLWGMVMAIYCDTRLLIK